MKVDWFIRITKNAQALKPAEVEVDEKDGLLGHYTAQSPYNNGSLLLSLLSLSLPSLRKFPSIFVARKMVGFYIVPPCEADCLVVVEAVDEDKNNIQHLAVTWWNAVTKHS